MTREKRASMALEKQLGEKSFYTLYGMCAQIPGRTEGSRLSPNQLLKYVKEGCPCFEHAGQVLFEKDLTVFYNWLRQRKPLRQIKAQERLRRIYGR